MKIKNVKHNRYLQVVADYINNYDYEEAYYLLDAFLKKEKLNNCENLTFVYSYIDADDWDKINGERITEVYKTSKLDGADPAYCFIIVCEDTCSKLKIEYILTD